MYSTPEEVNETLRLLGEDDPHVGFSRATRTMSSRISFAVGGRPGLRFLLPSYLAAMRQRYQRRSVAGVATDAIWASASRPKAWALTASLAGRRQRV